MVKHIKNESLRRKQLWISRTNKEVYLSEMQGYEKVEFRNYEEMMEYIHACIDSGYKVG